MIAVHTIDWRPMAALPEDRKDGRRMLLQSYGPWIGRWSSEEGGRWTAGAVELSSRRF